MRFFKFPVFFLLIYFLLVPFFSFSSYCEDGFRLPHSKLHFSDRVVRSGIIQASKRLFSSFVDPVKERILPNKWNEEAETPDLLKTFLPEGAYFIKHQQSQPGTATTVKLGEQGDEVMVRARYPFEGRELHTNVVFSKRALQSNMNTKNNWFVGEDAKAAFVFIHGGGTATTGSHVAAGMVTNLKKFKVDVVSLDMGWHAQGHREVLDFEAEIRALAAFVQKYIPPNVPVFVGGHSWGGVFAEKLMMMTDRPREKFFFHENLKAVLIFSTAVDAAPGKSFEEKKRELHRRQDDVNYNRQDEATPAEMSMWKQIVKDGKFSILGGWYASGTMFQLDQSLPVHRGKKYIPAYVVVGKYDPLVYIGFEDLYDKRYNSLENVVYNVLDFLPSRYTKKGEPLKFIKVGHLLGEHSTLDGKESNVQYALIRNYIELELKKSAVKDMKQLISESLQLSSLDVQTRESVLKDVEPLSSLEELNLFIYTNPAIQNLAPSSLGFLKKSLVEKADQSSLVGVTNIGDSVKNLIRQQLGLSSLNAVIKTDVAESVNNISVFEQMRHFMAGKFVANNKLHKVRGKRSNSEENESKNNSINMFIAEQDPMFFEAINDVINRRLEEYARSSVDISIIDTVQYFANDLAFREHQRDYIHYEYSGNTGAISDRNSKILLEVGNIVEHYYNPQARAVILLRKIRDIDRITNEKWKALVTELGYITTDDNMRRIGHKGGDELLSLKEQMRTSALTSLTQLSVRADDIINMRTAKGELIFEIGNGERAENHRSKRTKQFIAKVKTGDEKEVGRLMDEMGLSTEDQKRLDLLLQEFYFNNHIANGYFLFREEDLLRESPANSRETVAIHYRNLQRINAEWKEINRQKRYYSSGTMENALFQMHERLFQKIEGDIKTIREALNVQVPISPPDSLKRDQEKLDDLSEKMVSVANELMHIFDGKAVQIFQKPGFSSKEVDEILKEGTETLIPQFLELYRDYVRERGYFNKRAIVAMELGEMEGTIKEGEKSLKEAVISIYGIGSRGNDPVLLAVDKNNIDKGIDKIKASKKMMIENHPAGEKSLREAVVSLYEVTPIRKDQNPNVREKEIENTIKRIKSLGEVSGLEEIRLKADAIERISGFLAFRYLIEQLAKVEMKKQELEKLSKMNRQDYIEDVEHLKNLIPDSSSDIHKLLLVAHTAFKTAETPAQDILYKKVEDWSKQEQLDYIRTHRSIFGGLSKKWNDARSAPPPFLPTVYQ
ncbi:MAG: alpha/beta fold hydrolase [Bdellovibrionales bacterium]|nr:alpha/beta fold hydrolase [Bdellovibrionales bacterium]